MFLDRDGVVITDDGFVGEPERALIADDVPDALRRLERAGFARIVVTNQSGVARGYFSEDDVARVHASIAERLAAHGASIDAFYVCPHYDDGCACRKPAPGMIHRAVAEHDLDLPASAVVGDRGSDIALAHGVGIPGVLLEGPKYPYQGPEPDARVTSLGAAADWIIARGRG